MKAYRNISDLPLKRRAKASLGFALRNLMPQLASQVREKPFDPRWGVAGRLIRNGHLAEAVGSRDHETLQRFFMDYWSSGTSAEFYDRYARRFEELFLRFHAGIVEEIADAMRHFDPAESRIVEVGSGDGRVLSHLAQRFPSLGAFHGIDLNAWQIANCRKVHRESSNLFFHDEDIMSWMNRNRASHTIFVTNGGVLEYLLRNQVRELFQLLRKDCTPCVIAITETLAIDHDLPNELESIPYGHEMAFSHNYGAILREAGFNTRWQNERLTQEGEENHPARWMQMVAEA
jgi:trans-aconitate methyltransferase